MSIDERSGAPVRPTSLRAKNLNLLPVVLELLQTRSVTRASERLHLSQSSTSEGLAKARALFGDELLVRVGRSMVRTEFGDWLEPRLAESLRSIHDLFTEHPLDVESIDRRFVIATADYNVMLLAGPLIRRLRDQAPNARVQFIDLRRQSPRALERGDVDALIMPAGVIELGELPSMSLFEERYVAIAKRGHVASRGARDRRSGRARLTKKKLESAPYAAYRASADLVTSAAREALQRAGVETHEVMSIPQFTLLPNIVAETDALALVQERLAVRFAQQAEIEILEPGFEVPTLDMRAYWPPLFESDREHEWFRNQLLEIAATV